MGADFCRISAISWEVSQEDISLFEPDDNNLFLSSVIYTAAYPNILLTRRSSYRLTERLPTTLPPSTNVLEDRVSHIKSPKHKSN